MRGTSFAALIAGLGIAVGAAWGGLLSNFAAGVFILVLRPFKVERGPVLAVRPYCNTAHYWQVYFDTNRTIRETFGAAGYPAPEAHYHLRRAG